MRQHLLHDYEIDLINNINNDQSSLSSGSPLSILTDQILIDEIKDYNGNEDNTPREEDNNDNSKKQQQEYNLPNIKNGEQYKWGSISQPNPNTIYVRGKQYLNSKQKQLSDNIVFSLAHCECFKTDERIDHIATHPSSWYYKNIYPSNNYNCIDNNIFILIIQLQVTSIPATLVTYHYVNININDLKFNKLFQKFLISNDDYRSSKLKLIPRVVDGPYPVRKAVENRPVLIATKVKHRYFKGSNYFEIDAQVDESYIAQTVIKLCYRFSKSIVVDIAWVLQGDNEDELPERTMAGVTLHNINFDKVSDINNHRCNSISSNSNSNSNDNQSE